MLIRPIQLTIGFVSQARNLEKVLKPLTPPKVDHTSYRFLLIA